ncbi:MAG: Methyltransferase FkbM family [candidate division TM6 bacterium GW2011_GWF2_28_16]|nr:MAG: Methyltransferase FkbM family [candidate division TM6 bacterium GW2011_GWF2_28_16]
MIKESIYKIIVLIGNSAFFFLGLIYLKTIPNFNFLTKIIISFLVFILLIYLSKKLILNKFFFKLLTIFYCFLGSIFIISLILGKSKFNDPLFILNSTQNTINAIYNIKQNKNIQLKINKNEILIESLNLLTKQLIYQNNYKLRKTKFFKWTVNFFNYRILNYLFQEIFLNNCYFFNTNSKQPNIIDCGSNIGISILYFKKIYPESKIICFEPDKQTFEILKNNIEQNKLKNVLAQNIALSNKNEYLKFYYDKNTPGNLKMSYLPERINSGQNYEMVKATKLSNYINEDIDFLKMDIEGAETDVIKELYKNNKLKYINQMVIEFHHHISKSNYNNLSVILKILEKSNFSYQINTNTNTPFEQDKIQDILIFAYQKTT